MLHMLILIKLGHKKNTQNQKPQTKTENHNPGIFLLFYIKAVRKSCGQWDMEIYIIETMFNKLFVPAATDNISKNGEWGREVAGQCFFSAYWKIITIMLLKLCFSDIFLVKNSHRGKLCNSRACSEHINHWNLPNKQRLHHHILWPWICKE